MNECLKLMCVCICPILVPSSHTFSTCAFVTLFATCLRYLFVSSCLNHAITSSVLLVSSSARSTPPTIHSTLITHTTPHHSPYHTIMTTPYHTIPQHIDHIYQVIHSFILLFFHSIHLNATRVPLPAILPMVSSCQQIQ